MAKTKRRKNQKDLDFQKVKLKVGRKLKRDDNETKAEFRSRKIILKEVKSYSNDPLKALARHSDHISFHGKLTMLNHFNTAMTPSIVSSLNKPILDSLSKFLIDHSDQVRSAAIKCLKTCYNNLKQTHIPTKDFLFSLKPYLDCAYTHVSREIIIDCQKFLEYFVNVNDPDIFEPLMAILLRRYEAGMLSTKDTDLAAKLRHYFLRHRQKQVIEDELKRDRMKPLIWSESNFYINLDKTIHFCSFDDEREITVVSKEKKEDVIDKFLQITT